MTVPAGDLVCRLIKPEYWNDEEDAPMYQTFTASNRRLTLWHQVKIESSGDSLDDLCVNQFEGFGHAILSVENSVAAAEYALPGSSLDPRVIWNREGAEGYFSRWADAHTDLVTRGGHKAFLTTYKRELAKRCCVGKRPTGINGSQ